MGSFWRVLRFVALVLCALAAPAQADSGAEIAAANRQILDGRVRKGLDDLLAIFRRIDPGKAPIDYLHAGRIIADVLYDVENSLDAGPVLEGLGQAWFLQKHPEIRPLVQVLVGRALIQSTDQALASKGKRLLQETAGNEFRHIRNPSERAAAVVLSNLELDSNNVAQSAIWMRRAVVGAAAEKGIGSEEIIDILSAYANFLGRTQRLREARDLFIKLSPFYNRHYSRREPKYLRFASSFLTVLRTGGAAQAAAVLHKQLEGDAAAVDIVPASVKDNLFLQEFYRIAQERPADMVARLKEIMASYPEFAEKPRNRVIFSFFASLVGEIDLPAALLSGIPEQADLDEEFSAYLPLMRSYVAVRRQKSEESFALLREGLEKLRRSRQRFERETGSHLPAIKAEEKAVLGSILGSLALRARSNSDASTVFELAQFLNREKVKLGLNNRTARQAFKSELEREDVGARDRLKELRDRVMEDAVAALLSRVLPFRASAPGKDNDVAFLMDLEEFEDKISLADERSQASDAEFLTRGSDAPVGLAQAQQQLRPDEALVLHSFAHAGAVVTACVTAKSWTFHVTPPFTALDARQLAIDEKLVTAAVHASHSPSALLDASFPAESSHRLYQLLLGPIEACFRDKKLLLLATDPDLFATPWNVLLTNMPPPGTEFRHRSAAWLPKSHAISLLPSVRAFHQLRTALPISQARQDFLGVGAPEFRGKREPDAHIALSQLYSARGVADRTAIANLPPLPEGADELQAIAKVAGDARSRILLGKDASEREVRKQLLDDYRVISFATHALVAGEIDGVTEPALVLTPGAEESNRGNDGLLTASEIASLKLDANLVILSACNTAAPDGRTSGRGLSGLADAFFLAGARALAVTQWSVFSHIAKVLGSELVAQTESGSRTIGVAEGLRRTMVNYISAADEDYRAHPRFWAAFVIAGDGATRPLGGMTQPAPSSRPISLDWEHVATDPGEVELLSIAQLAGSLLVDGIQLAPEKGQRNGRYMVEVTESGGTKLIAREIGTGASGLVPLGGKVGVLGFVPTATKSTAVFRLQEPTGRVLWQHEVDSDYLNLPLGIVDTANAYILVSVEDDYLKRRVRPTLILTALSFSGTVLSQKRYLMPMSLQAFSGKGIAIDRDGNLIVALQGFTEDNSGQPSFWTNPRTGSKVFCIIRDVAILFSIRPSDLAVQEQRVLQDVLVTRLRRHGDRLYATTATSAVCNGHRSLTIAELSSRLELTAVFETRGINSIESSDFVVANEAFIVVGQLVTTVAMSTREPAAPRPARTILGDQHDWEAGSMRTSAFVLAVGRDGTLLADRVFADPRRRRFASLAALGSNRFVAVGSAFGDRGLAVGFSLNVPDNSFWNRLKARFGQVLDWFR